MAGLDPAIHPPHQRTISSDKSRQSGLSDAIKSIAHAA
jgi:hypothetical protein